MIFKEIQKILEDNTFYALTVNRNKDGYNLSYTFHSIAYYTVPIIVNVLRADKERIVTKVKIGTIEINDEKELISTLKGVYKIHNRILYGKHN